MNQLREGFLAHYLNQIDIATVVQRHPDPILITNSENEIIYTNTTGARLLCRLPENNGLIHEEINQHHKFSFMISINDLSGETLSFDVARTELQWDEEPATMFSLHDITPHKLYCNELEELVYSDHLTGLYNSRGLEVLSAHVRSIAARNHQSITSFYIDINNLKTINDNYGHSMGDTAIIETAELINHCFRNADVCARVGGDEFVVLTLDEADEPVNAILKRLETEIEKCNNISGRCFQLSVSVGVSRHLSDHTFNIQELIKEADKRMYIAKKSPLHDNLRQCHIHPPLTDATDFTDLLMAV